MIYTTIIERGDTSWGALVPDLPRCTSVAETRDAVDTLIHEAIKFHVEGMRENGDPIPEARSEGMKIHVA